MPRYFVLKISGHYDVRMLIKDPYPPSPELEPLRTGGSDPLSGCRLCPEDVKSKVSMISGGSSKTSLQCDQTIPLSTCGYQQLRYNISNRGIKIAIVYQLSFLEVNNYSTYQREYGWKWLPRPIQEGCARSIKCQESHQRHPYSPSPELDSWRTGGP